MDKLKMHSLNKVNENISKIAALFPNCVTERKGESGEIEYAIDFDMLRREFAKVRHKNLVMKDLPPRSWNKSQRWVKAIANRPCKNSEV